MNTNVGVGVVHADDCLAIGHWEDPLLDGEWTDGRAHISAICRIVDDRFVHCHLREGVVDVRIVAPRPLHPHRLGDG